MKNTLVLTLILIIGAILRLYNYNWDSSHHLQPDERFLIMVTRGLEWPQKWYQYFDVGISKLNPHNVGFDYFVYGNLPLLIVKFVAGLFKMTDYDSMTIMGRFVSAGFDLGTIGLIFIIVRKLKLNSIAPFLAAFTYATAVLPIQLSHYFAVDTFLVFFLTLTTLLLIILNSTSDFRKEIVVTVLLGISLALAISCKISTLYLLPTLSFCAIIKISDKVKKIKEVIILFSCFIVSLIIFLKLFQPYLFSSSFSLLPNPKVLANWEKLKWLYNIDELLKNNSSEIFPPAVQFLTTTQYIFPLINLFFLVSVFH